MAAVLVAAGPAWRFGRLGITAVHEAGHALAAVLSGRRVTAIHLRPDTSGVTYHRGPARGARSWPGRLLTSIAGYPAPGAAGLAGAWFVSGGHPRAWLTAVLLLGLTCGVLWVRNLFGGLLAIVWVGLFGWLAIYATGAVDRFAATLTCWYLLLGGLRAANEQFGRAGAGDAADVARLLHVPVVVCKATFWGLSAAALAAGAVLLFGGGGQPRWIRSL